MDLYSAFIVAIHTQDAQVWITQLYLQITPYLPTDRDCTAQYNCCLPATTDCRRFCRFVLL